MVFIIEHLEFPPDLISHFILTPHLWVQQPAVPNPWHNNLGSSASAGISVVIVIIAMDKPEFENLKKI